MQEVHQELWRVIKSGLQTRGPDVAGSALSAFKASHRISDSIQKLLRLLCLPDGALVSTVPVLFFWLSQLFVFCPFTTRASNQYCTCFKCALKSETWQKFAVNIQFKFKGRLGKDTWDFRLAVQPNMQPPHPQDLWRPCWKFGTFFI